MSRRTVISLTITAIVFIAAVAIGRRNSQAHFSVSARAAVAERPPTTQTDSSKQQLSDPQVTSTSAQSSVTPANIQYSDPPNVDVGLSVEQAYAAIPHRRTVWNESESTVPDEDRAYLRTIFQVIDQAIAVRVAGLQNFSKSRFDSVNIDAQWDRLIAFTQGMTVPKDLTSYHQDVLASFSNERQFFSEWKSRGDQFEFARQIPNHSGVRAASAAARAAYNEIMARYPNENQNNKDAFYDYHCALDFL